MGHPLRTGHRRSFFQHAVHLFKSKTLGLRNQEVGVEETEDAKRAPEEEDLGSEIDTATCSRGDVWCDNCDDLGGLLANDFISGGDGERGLSRTQFHSQLDAVDKATPRDRIGSGKTSPITTHAPGPHVVAKKKI